MENSNIEWTDHTFNPWIGCTKVDELCAHCYAEARDIRFNGGQHWGKGAPRQRTTPSNWNEPRRWNREEGAKVVGHADFVANRRPRVFCASLADWLDDEVPIEWLVDLLRLVHECPNLDWLVLSKRPENFFLRLRLAAEALDKATLIGYTSERDAPSKRTAGLRGSEIRRIGDRHTGKNLAHEETHGRSMDGRDKDNSVQTRPGGDGEWQRLPTGEGDAGREKNLRGSTSLGLAAFQRTDSTRTDDQSQTRLEGGQPSGGTGVGDLQRTTKSRHQDAGGTSPRREGGEASDDKFDGRGRSDDAAASSRRRDGEKHRGTLPDEAEGGQRHSLPANVDSSAVAKWIRAWLDGRPPSNVWIGTSVGTQKSADRRIPELLKIPARVRFLSCEPLLGPVEFSNVTHRADCIEQLGKPALGGIHWVIAGGESGKGARPMHPQWARSLRDQCRAVGVPFFFKQHGEWAPARTEGSTVSITTENSGCPENPEWFTFPDGQEMARVGKKVAGRLLDGERYDAFPV